jgi:transcriptional regulator GlxA family with amidase domain
MPLIDLLFIITPHCLLLDIAGPAEAFRLANLHRELRGMPPRFNLRFAGLTASAPTSVGLTIANLEPLPAQLTAPTWVIIVGQPSAQVKQLTTEILATAQWLNAALHQHLANPDTPHRLLTICSGTLLAARADLLGTAAPRITSCYQHCAR